MNRRAAWLKVAMGGAALAASMYFLWTPAVNLLKPEQQVDGGRRGLLVIASNGGNSDQILHVKQSFDGHGKVELAFSFAAPEAKSNRRPVNYSLHYIGDAFGEIRCGEGATAEVASFSSLPAGAQNAVKADLVSRSNSATNYGDESEESRDLEKLQSELIVHTFSGVMWPYDSNDEKRSQRRSANGESVFTESCTFATETAWRLPATQTFESATRKTLLPFQVNWSGIEATDVHRKIESAVTIDRQEGVELINSYPEATSHDYRWTYTNTSYWIGSRTEVGNFGYTDQPVYLFEKRNADEGKSIQILWFGVFLGVALSIAVQIVSKLIDLYFDSQLFPGAHESE
ncbi:hypothetical protein [Rhodococcus pyridinivorans]